MYVYAIFCIGVCVGASFMGFSAFSITRRRLLFYLSIFVLCYGVEQAIVFFNEFLSQNIPFSSETFSGLEDPSLHILTGAIMCQALWMAVLDFFDDTRRYMRYLPLCVFLAVSLLALLLPFLSDPVRKWLIYTIRQVFFLWDVLYCVLAYRKTTSKTLRMRYRSKTPILAAFLALTILVVAEDTIVMLLIDPETVGNPAVLAYLYRRNTCESLLVFGVVAFTMYQSVRALQLKREEMTLPETTQERAHARDILPYFARKHGLTPREQEILAYVIEGKDNLQIAQQLQVSIGTVKTHTHHLFKKTETKNREELLAAFWAER